MKFEDIILLTILVISSAFILLSFILLFQIIPSNIIYKNFRDNKKVEKLILEAAKFYYTELGIKGNPHITVNPMWSPELFFDTHGYVQKKPGKDSFQVVIYINHNIYSILETVAHEIIHVHQYNRGDLINCGIRKLWKGKDHTETEYWERPWEKEAFKNEKSLAKKFFKHKGMRKPLILSGIDWIVDKLDKLP